MPTPYRLCYADDPEDHIIEAFSTNNNYPNHSLDKEIRFTKWPFFSPRKRMIFKMRKPHSYLISGNNQIEIRVYGYRRTVFGFQAKMFFYFVNNVFFMGEYVFLSYSPERVIEIRDSVFKEYGITSNKQHKNFYINGNNHTGLFFFDTAFEVNLRYFSKGNEVVNKLIGKSLKGESEPEVNTK